MRRIGSALALALTLASAGRAHAHHPVPSSPTSVAPRSRAALDLSAAEFDLGRPGSWWMATLALEHAFFGRVSLGATVPVAHVRYDDGYHLTGPGDVETTVRGLLYGDDRYALAASFGVELPTGDQPSGLGGGHVMLSPGLAMSFRPLDPVFVLVAVRGHFGVSEARTLTEAEAPSPETRPS